MKTKLANRTTAICAPLDRRSGGGGAFKQSLVIIVGCTLLVGCARNTLPSYSVSSENVSQLRKMEGVSVAVGEFTGSQGELTEMSCCLGGKVSPPGDDMTFYEYIRDAFVAELQLGDAYDADSDVVLLGNLDNIAFASGSGRWDIALTITSSNSQSVSVTTSYEYDAGFFGETACQNTAQAIIPAVRTTIAAVLNDPGFATLLYEDAESPPDGP